MLNKAKKVKAPRKQTGFTLFELLVAIAIVAIILTIALPSLGQFTASMRADNEVSEVHRLLLTARSTAINTGKSTTICHLSGTNCTANWTGDFIVFTNNSNSANLDNYDNSGGEETIATKPAIQDADSLKFYTSSTGVVYKMVVYTPTGQIAHSESQGSFVFCPAGYKDEARSVTISASGRPYLSTKNAAGVEVDRTGTAVKSKC